MTAIPDTAQELASVRAPIIMAVQPAFLMPPAAGKYLGHSTDWLREKAKEHDLFKPTIRGRGKGSPGFYHRDHLSIIESHMMDPDNFTADIALAAWTRQRQNKIMAHLEPPKKGARK